MKASVCGPVSARLVDSKNLVVNRVVLKLVSQLDGRNVETSIPILPLLRWALIPKVPESTFS